ncbi:MAG: flagellar protein FlaG [Defluviitaleaceae bacterium]|nr:flagellar protein FlaG [Defluviitaleaceae bacterium]
MEVNRINGNGYQTQAPAPPPPPMVGSGEFAPSPVTQAPAYVPYTPSPAAVADTGGSGGSNGGEPDTLRRAVSEINSSIAIYRRHLGVSHHEATNRRIITVYDSDTNEVVRQIPPESVLEAHANMLEMVGIFMDTRG